MKRLQVIIEFKSVDYCAGICRIPAFTEQGDQNRGIFDNLELRKDIYLSSFIEFPFANF